MPVFAEKSQENRRFFKISTQKQARKEPARFVRRIVRYCLNSITDIDIKDEELALVRREHGSPEEYSGKIIVALTEYGNTLKRLFWKTADHAFIPKTEDTETCIPSNLK